MKNLQENLEELNDCYLELLKHLGRMLDINIEAIRDGKTTPKLYGECFVVEDVINGLEVKIKEDSINSIARFQPAAKNLRELIMLIDGARLVERMGDILKTNFKTIKEIEQENPEITGRLDKTLYEYLLKIKKIYESYVLAFSESDEEILYSLISVDEDINKETNRIVEKIGECVKKAPDETMELLNALILVKKYERFAEHVIHLVVDLVYILKGENLRKKELLNKNS